MTTLPHATVAQRAHHHWHQLGCPPDRDTEIWLEAERQLAAEQRAEKSDTPGKTKSPAPPDAATDIARIKSETAAESTVEFHLSPALSDDQAIQAALQKKIARAPSVPHHTGPKAKPVESGKPLWNKPHSS